MLRIVVTIALGLLSGMTFAATTLKGSVYSPDPGTICDKKAGFCADYEGVSVALTKMYLGDKAEKNLMDQINKVGIKDFDASTFTLSDGITCDCKAKQCKEKLSGKLDAAHTKALFGTKPK